MKTNCNWCGQSVYVEEGLFAAHCLPNSSELCKGSRAARSAEPTSLADAFFGPGASAKLAASAKRAEAIQRAHARRQAWERFAAGALAGLFANPVTVGETVASAAIYADEMTAEWEKRFNKIEATPEDIAQDVVDEMVPR